MSKLDEMAAFVHRTGYDALSRADCDSFKLHVLDTIGCAIGALDGEPVLKGRRVIDSLGGSGQCTLIGGGRTSLPHAAYFNGSLVRYLDFMDAYLAESGECHPCDNFACLLAAAEHARRSGRDLLGALAVSYQIICALSRDTKMVKHGFDHTTTLTFSMSAGISKLLGLNEAETANAMAVAGADCAGPMSIRTEPISNWKGLASAETAYRTMFCVLLAHEGITSPPLLFEGPSGLEKMTQDPWKTAWAKKPLDAIGSVMIKKFDAEARSQSALEATLELKAEHQIDADAVKHVRVDTFRLGYDNLGGGKFGPKDNPLVKEQADHNLKYIVAAALLDGDVWPAQYAPDRVTRPDVQSLLHKVDVEPKLTYTWREPQQQPTRVTITLKDGQKFVCEKDDFEGFPSRPMSWERVVEKFDRLAAPHADDSLRSEIVAAVKELEAIDVVDLTKLLAQVDAGAHAPLHATVPVAVMQ